MHTKKKTEAPQNSAAANGIVQQRQSTGESRIFADNRTGNTRNLQLKMLSISEGGSQDAVLQRMKKLSEKPEEPKKPDWQNQSWYHQDDDGEYDNGREEFESAVPEAQAAAAAAPSSSVQLTREAMPGKQIGTNGTLFMERVSETQHYSYECRTDGSGGLVVTGGHLTDERIPEGKEGRHVRRITNEEKESFEKRAIAKQRELDKKEQEKRNRERQQQEAARKAEERNVRVAEIKGVLNHIYGGKPGQKNITDIALGHAVDIGWTAGQVKSAATNLNGEKDVAQLATKNS